MIMKLNYIFIPFLVLFSFLLETQSLETFSTNKKKQEISSSHSNSVTLAISTISAKSCEDCKGEHCDDHENHCSHHCPGLHNISFVETNFCLSQPSILNSNLSWLFYNNYLTPNLNPSLKPPTLS